ncbi:polysaccharide pyruvyl transferase protein [Rhizobium sp. NXC14]|uniref:polysaccharide pyruvyl transferase family protein n=1 Tax=Rhizobium sp. NXC14 TaxID=1981173 RepID=UPI000A20670B|nr:polysaccharide pyruvyl transferase family protein [Rhizobium sp. NXC14]ARO30830.1 polysaccharide pyruvyl transferase protein [Rhizobium sp. NXC14]
MSKAGILTFHRCINYGSYWQARCLAEGLASMGVEAVLLEHMSDRVNRAEWQCALKPLLPAATPKEDYPLYKAKIRKFFQSFASLPLSSPFPLENPAAMDDYSLIVVGSDEVWNLRHPWYGGYPVFYGEGLRCGRVVSYAATFGSLTSSERLEGWAEKLRKFSHISVRDLHSERIIRETLGIEPELVLDPCLQFPQTMKASRDDGEAAAYIAVYGHSFPTWFQDTVRRWAGDRDYPLVSIGYRNDWADEQWIDAGPEDFASFISEAKAVVTNFFHGCVFSLVNDKPFACVLSDYRSNKIRDLTRLVRAEDHVLTEDTTSTHLDGILGNPLPMGISERISSLRDTSNAYLSHALQ